MPIFDVGLSRNDLSHPQVINLECHCQYVPFQTDAGARFFLYLIIVNSYFLWFFDLLSHSWKEVLNIWTKIYLMISWGLSLELIPIKVFSDQKIDILVKKLIFMVQNSQLRPPLKICQPDFFSELVFRQFYLIKLIKVLDLLLNNNISLSTEKFRSYNF